MDGLEEKVLDLCHAIDIMWKDDSTHDDVQEEADAIRKWIAERKES